MQLTKYPQRNGVAGRDLLRLSHPKAADLGKRKREEDVDAMNLVLHYATHPADEVRNQHWCPPETRCAEHREGSSVLES